MKSQSVVYLLKVSGLAIAYWATSKIGLHYTATGPTVSAVWLPAGVALAGLLLFGLRAWPGVMLGAYLVSYQASPIIFIGGMFGKTLGAWLSARLLQRLVGFDNQIDRLRNVLSFLLLGVSVSSVLTAATSVSTMCLSGRFSWQDFAVNWGRWGIGDGLGILIGTPLLLILFTENFRTWTARQIMEMAGWLLGLLTVTWLIFGQVDGARYLQENPYFIFPLVLLCVLRLGQVGGVAATFMITAIAVAETSQRHGPFSQRDNYLDDLQSLQIFIGSLSAMPLLFGAAISERRQSEQALRKSEAELRALFAAMKDIIATLDAQGRYLKIAPTDPTNFYKPPEDVVGKTVHEIFPPEKAQYFLNKIQRALSTKQVVELEYSLPIGLEAKWFTGTISPLTDTSVMLVVHDQTEQRKALEKVGFQASLLDVVEKAVIATDLQGNVIYWNHFAEKLYGWSAAAAMNRNIAELIPAVGAGELDGDMLVRCQNGGSWSGEDLWQAQGGQKIPVWVTAAPIQNTSGELTGIVTTSSNLTERKKLEEQLRQSQKMEAIGKLAGGIAHDFNNLLTAINGYSQLLINQLGETDPRRHRATEIKRAGERAAALTQQLLAFSRKQILQPKVIDFNRVIAETAQLLKPMIGENIQLVTTLDAGEGKVKVDQGQILQVVLNLAVNARDAMPNGGTLVIATATVELSAGAARAFQLPQAGRYVELTVSDDGCGMKDETQSQIFEPFFTTKAQGKGTGLGLSSVYGIVNQSGGSVQVASQVGRGTVFTIHFPHSDEPITALIADEITAAPHASAQTILLVEDEELVRQMAHSILTDSGYCVLVAEDGLGALQLLRQHSGKVELLLTDVVMPHLSGYELAKQAAALQPEMKILYMSGYTDSLINHSSVMLETVPFDATFMQKPFTLEALLNKVRETLAQTDRSQDVTEIPVSSSST